MSCVFCAIVAGEGPAIRIYEDEDYLAILDRAINAIAAALPADSAG